MYVLVRNLHRMDGHVNRRGLTIVLPEVDSGSIQSFLRAHRSFERKNRQDGLNLFCFFWNTPKNERKEGGGAHRKGRLGTADNTVPW